MTFPSVLQTVWLQTHLGSLHRAKLNAPHRAVRTKAIIKKSKKSQYNRSFPTLIFAPLIFPSTGCPTLPTKYINKKRKKVPRTITAKIMPLTPPPPKTPTSPLPRPSQICPFTCRQPIREQVFTFTTSPAKIFGCNTTKAGISRFPSPIPGSASSPPSSSLLRTCLLFFCASFLKNLSAVTVAPLPRPPRSCAPLFCPAVSAPCF